MSGFQQGGLIGRAARLLGRGAGAARRQAAQRYVDVVARARQPVLYAEMGVPDDPAGRFEMIAWHVLVELERIRRAGGDHRDGQSLVDLMFTDMDRSLRELGVGDLSVGRQMRKLGETWKARTVLAQSAFAERDQTALAMFLARNLAGEVDAARLAAHLLAEIERDRPAGTALAGQSA